MNSSTFSMIFFFSSQRPRNPACFSQLLEKVVLVAAQLALLALSKLTLSSSASSSLAEM